MARGRKKSKREEVFSDDEMHGLTDSDDEIDNTEERKDISSDEDVFGLGDSDGEDDKSNDDDFDMGSDIEEGSTGLPDDRAWGKNKRRFYNTDYVDQDYEGFYQGKEAEAAELEEQEARQIQKRLAEQLNENDFDIVLPVESQPTVDCEAYETIETDVSKLSIRQKLDLMRKESPEFFVLVEDFKAKLLEIEQKLSPVLSFLKKREQKSPLVQFLQKKFLILINYCTNISFYLLLKARRLSVKNHPVLKSLYQYRKLLEQIQEIDEMIQPQLDSILKSLESGVEPFLFKKQLQSNVKERKILQLLSKTKEKFRVGSLEMKNSERSKGLDIMDHTNNDKDDKSETSEAEEPASAKKAEKRAITYEMAKNKGLMPKRNKIQRNPRVKHRMKYKKALIRRRGQVRTARAEIPLYGGEPTGIKVGITKSIKFK